MDSGWFNGRRKLGGEVGVGVEDQVGLAGCQYANGSAGTSRYKCGVGDNFSQRGVQSGYRGLLLAGRPGCQEGQWTSGHDSEIQGISLGRGGYVAGRGQKRISSRNIGGEAWRAEESGEAISAGIGDTAGCERVQRQRPGAAGRGEVAVDIDDHVGVVGHENINASACSGGY